MESVNHIGKLQEFCQKHKLGIPKYNVVNIGGPPHMPKFKSYLKLCDGREYEGPEFHNSKEAKQNVAKLVYNELINNNNGDLINNNQLLDINITRNNSKFINVLVDLENLPNFMDQLDNLLETYKFSNLEVFGFSSTNHPQSIKHSTNPGLKLIESNAPNACDTGMIMFITGLILNRPPDLFLVATNDHNFASGLQDCIKTNFIGKSLNINIPEIDMKIIRNPYEILNDYNSGNINKNCSIKTTTKTTKDIILDILKDHDSLTKNEIRFKLKLNYHIKLKVKEVNQLLYKMNNEGLVCYDQPDKIIKPLWHLSKK